MSRLISCEVTDSEGLSSDTVSIELNDWPLAEIPRKGAQIKVWMGYAEQGISYMGSYVAEEIEVGLLPFSLFITGKAAEMRKKTKEHQERHWDNKSVKDVVSQIAGEHGLTPKIDSEIGAHVYEWLGQLNESPIHFLERLAERFDALFDVKDGNLIFAKRGSGQSASGAALTPIVVTPQNILEGTGRVRFSDRYSYKSVRASYRDKEKEDRTSVEEDSDTANGEAIYTLRDQFADEAEAKMAAKAKGKQLKRRQVTYDCTLIGNPAVRAGAPLTFAVGRPGIDGIPFITGTATHRIDKGGFTTQSSGESQDGPSAS